MIYDESGREVRRAIGFLRAMTPTPCDRADLVSAAGIHHEDAPDSEGGATPERHETD